MPIQVLLDQGEWWELPINAVSLNCADHIERRVSSVPLSGDNVLATLLSGNPVNVVQPAVIYQAATLAACVPNLHLSEKTAIFSQGHTRVRFHATGRLPVPGQCAPAQGSWAILSAMGTSRLRTVQARLDCQRQLFLEESGSHSARSLPQLSETSPRSSRVLRHGALSGAQWLPNVSYERLGRRPAATRLDAGACETVIENKAFATCV